MCRLNIAVLISGGGTNLQALIDAEKRGEIPDGRISLVLSNKKEAYGLERARRAGIEGLWIAGGAEDELLSCLRSRQIDLVILAGYLAILSAEFTKAYAGRIINVHPSLIPSFCGKGYYGLKVHEKALEYGVKVTGATVHYVNEIPDGGQIILQKAVEVLDGDTAPVLQERVMREAEWVLLPKAAQYVCAQILRERGVL